jgi:hypothetical protein
VREFFMGDTVRWMGKSVTHSRTRADFYCLAAT